MGEVGRHEGIAIDPSDKFVRNIIAKHLDGQYNNLQSRLVMRGSRTFSQRGSNFDNIFLVDEGSRAIIGLPAKRYLNGVSLVCR